MKRIIHLCDICEKEVDKKPLSFTAKVEMQDKNKRIQLVEVTITLPSYVDICREHLNEAIRLGALKIIEDLYNPPSSKVAVLVCSVCGYIPEDDEKEDLSVGVGDKCFQKDCKGAFLYKKETL
jgi:hypothetical protein